MRIKTILIIFVTALLVTVSSFAEHAQLDKAILNKRATIGLALGGGGAKGGAHIGVLRKLEELQIPIDYIAGTSMGAIVAGFYASGMSPDEIDEFMLSIDWWDLLDDQSSRRDMPFRRKEEDRRYMSGSEVGLRGYKFRLPSSLSSGQKMNNLFVKTTSHVAGIESFDALNIPFRCVATDLPTASAIILDKGNLAKAVRASMAVPGMFAPIPIDDYILVDGGLLNNIPVDVVKDMGADVVIAVDVSGAGDWSASDKSFSSVGEILNQTYLIMQRAEQDKKLLLADAIISPDTSEFGAGDFHKATGVIPTGYEATELKRDELAKYAVGKDEYSEFIAQQRVKESPDVIIETVSVVGNDGVDTRTILSCISIETNKPIDYKQLDRDIARIYALGGFEYVIYNLVQRENSDLYDVKFIAKEKPWGPGYLKFGIRLEADFNNSAYWGAAVNYTRHQLNSLGAEWRLEAQIGSLTALYADFYQPLTYSGSLFVSPIVQYDSSKENLFMDDVLVAEYDVDRMHAGLDIGAVIGTYAEFRLGYLVESVRASVDVGSSDLPDADDNIGALHGRFVVDTFDDSYFPSKGFIFSLTGRLASEDLGSDISYEVAEMLMYGVKSFNKHTLIGRLRMGSSFGSDVPGYDQFTLGGVSSFGGLSRGQLRGPYVGVASLGYRYRLGRLPPGLGNGVYALIRGDAGNVWQDQDDIDSSDLRYGLLGGLAADTAIGPVSLVYGADNEGGNSIYFSVGVQF